VELAQRGNAGRERQVADSCEPACRRRKRVSLYQPRVLRIANKAAAAVLLSVNRGARRRSLF
jgi:hypothetical protein